MAPGHARLVLTGTGGGVFTLPFGDHEGDTIVTIVTDVVDYCRMAAQRISIDELDMEMTGDASTGRTLLQAAAAFAV